MCGTNLTECKDEDTEGVRCAEVMWADGATGFHNHPHIFFANQCPAGQQPEGGTCSNCTPGTYSPQVGSAFCLTCTEGSCPRPFSPSPVP